MGVEMIGRGPDHSMCERIDKIRFEETVNLCREIDRLRTALAEAQRERDELRADLVFALRRGAWLQMDPEPFIRDVTTRPTSHLRFGNEERSFEYDGTDTDLCRAIREARRGE